MPSTGRAPDTECVPDSYLGKIMLFFAHCGITLGTVAALDYARRSLHKPAQLAVGHDNPTSAKASNPGHGASLNAVDYRLVLLGGILPDVIDKPLGTLFASTFGSGRLFCHSLLFVLLITLFGLYLYRRGKLWLLTIAFGCAIHLALDEMWLMPRTFVWPLYGLSFEKLDPESYVWSLDYVGMLINWLFTDPHVLVPEIVGTVILLGLVWRLVRGKKVHHFIRVGTIG